MNLDEIIEEIGNIKEPETGVDIKKLGILDGVDVRDNTITVYVNFSYMTPSCKACIPIHWMVTNAIVRKIVRVLKKAGIKYRVIESGIGTVYAEG